MSTTSDKYVGRTVEENGTDRAGVVLNAWDLPERVTGLYVKPFAGQWGKYGAPLRSDSEHWTIRKDGA